MEWIDINIKEPKTGEEVLCFRPRAKEYGDDTFTVLRYTAKKSIDMNGIEHKFERSHYVSHWVRLEKPNY